MIRGLAAVAGAIWLAALSACASIVSGNETIVHIESLPEAARCELKGDEFEGAVDAPGSVALPSRASPVSVSCNADGFKPGVETLNTTLDGWIFGNAIFGPYGVIGVAIDGFRGAGLQYPKETEIVLEPEKFASAEERDEFFDAWRDRIESIWSARRDKLDYRCRNSPGMEKGECDMLRERLNSRRAAILATIEGKRNSAIVEAAGSVN